MIQNSNPLMDFARKTECSVKLPSMGLWYDADDVILNAMNEVDVMPMLPLDEMKIVNPDSLVTGEAITEIIKSCCKGVIRPEKLYYPDVNVLLLAIRKATYGDEYKSASLCPKCFDKKNDIELSVYEKELKKRNLSFEDLDEDSKLKIREELKEIASKEVADKEKAGELTTLPTEITFSLSDMLDTITMMPKESIYNMSNGLKIRLAPYKCSDKILFTIKNIREQKLLEYYEKNRKDINEDVDGYVKLISSVGDLLGEIADKTIDIMAKSIISVELPDGSLVTNTEYISEFLNNISTDDIRVIQEKIDELNNCGLPQTLHYRCDCCGNEWDDVFHGFNQSDFFGQGS